MEQYSRKYSICIFGLAEPHDENPFDSVTFLCNTQMKMTPPVQIDEISNCHRIGSISPLATKPRPMIVRFAKNRAKQRVMEHRKKLKGIYGNSILGPKPRDVDAEDGPDDETENLEEATYTSPDITLPAADVNIPKVYINDDLCKARSIVAFRASELKSDKKNQ